MLIRLVDYSKDSLEERELATIEESFICRDRPTVSWVNIDGLHEVANLEKLGNHFDIHPLVLEDILNVHQRPKLEEQEKLLFIVLRMLQYDENTQEVASEQLSLVMGSNFVFSFQEVPGDVFNPVRDRIRASRPRIRGGGPDYLVYALMDAVVDHYFVILERLGERIEALEEMLMQEPSKKALEEIYRLKRELLTVRKSVWPLREVVGNLERSESKLIRKATHPYFRDVYDHTVQVLDSTENYRETVAGLLDLYLSSISNKTNDVMKVLTMIATIFIPLSFLCGLYGMNFEHMPELKYPWAYPALLVVMTLVSTGFIIYFKRKDWL